ncbi:MAG: phage portal protein [Lentisphaerae bacterium]|nr:phage portal protein [Lentisphaerota bacterium]
MPEEILQKIPKETTPKACKAADALSTRRIAARINAASRSADSQRNFSGADYLSADAALNRSVRRLISIRSRNEFVNNSYAYGIIHTLADDTIGTGPRLQLEPAEEGDLFTTDPKFQRREQRFHRWTRQIRLNALLRCARIAKALDGETFIWLQTNPCSGREVPLEPRLFEAEYVSSRHYQPEIAHASGHPLEADGISYDRYGNPISYRFSRFHPGSSGGFAVDEGVQVPAEQIIHYANLVRAGQHRGLSEMAACLHIFNDLRRYSTAVVLAAEVAANLSFIISHDLPPELYEQTIDHDAEGRVITALDLQGGPGEFVHGSNMGLSFPAGYKASQLKAEQPTATYVTFKDAKIAEAARVFSMPFNIASGNSSDYNYASGRLDHQVYHKKLLIERENIAVEILDRILAAWEEYDQVLHPADYRIDSAGHSWMWDGFEHVDPIKEANAQAARLTNGVTTLAEECAREGRDYHNVLRQRRREFEECARLGLPPMPWMAPQQTPSFAPDSGDDDKKAKRIKE